MDTRPYCIVSQDGIPAEEHRLYIMECIHLATRRIWPNAFTYTNNHNPFSQEPDFLDEVRSYWRNGGDIHHSWLHSMLMRSLQVRRNSARKKARTIGIFPHDDGGFSRPPQMTQSAYKTIVAELNPLPIATTQTHATTIHELCEGLRHLRNTMARVFRRRPSEEEIAEVYLCGEGAVIRCLLLWVLKKHYRATHPTE